MRPERTVDISERASVTEDLLYEVREGVGYLTFNRPKTRNALTFEMYEGLAQVCEGITIGSGVSALIIAGTEDTAFAAGTDISQFRAFTEPQDALEYEARMEEVLELDSSRQGVVSGNMVGISDGIEAGDIIAAAGVSFLRDGQRVKLMGE